MKRALVTGGSGFVGANLARRLLRDGHEVHLLLRDEHQPWRLQEIMNDCRPIRGDLTIRESVRDAVAAARPDWVFHLAAYGAYPSQTGFERMVAVNLMGSANLIESCAEAGVEFLANAGSSSEYGYKTKAAHEGDLLEPNSHYAITKAAATHYGQHVARSSGLRCVTLRLYSIFGPYEEPTRLIPSLLVHALRGALPPLAAPETARDFVHVDDAVAALILAAGSGATKPGTVYNVSSGTQTTLADVVGHVRRALDVAAEPVWGSMSRREWDTNVWCGDSSALRRDTGWQPQIAIARGLELAADWLRANPRWIEFYESRLGSAALVPTGGTGRKSAG